MATQLDLQEQEQLDQLKAFWNQYGNLVTWLLVLLLGAYAGWNGWNYWQRDQAVKAGAMYDELERSAQSGDAERTVRMFTDLKDRFGRTAYAAHAGLLTSRVQFDKGQVDAARASLAWVAEKGGDESLRSVARVRLAGILLDAKKLDEALQQLDAATAPGLEALVADRRGDVLLAQGKKTEARAAYQVAYQGMSIDPDYRRLIDAKLTALGAAPAAPAAAASGAAS
jgi:predicted negative regulator of RcsB-dependent stress response